MINTSRSGKSKIPAQVTALLIALALPFCVFASPFSVNGQLHVSGNQLVNECGSPVQLRGVSSHGLQWYGLISCFDFCCISASGISYLANTVGIDVFRIAMYPEPNGYISNPSGFTQQVNNIVQMCEDNGIYALIDWHVLTPGDPNADIVYARTFWESMATAHKDSRNVLYEICNEPNGVSWDQVKTYANDIIPRIRAIDPDAVIIVGTPNWSQLGSDVVNNKFPTTFPYNNLMYTFHFYAATHNTGMLSSYVGQLPIFVSEWAATEASGLGATNYPNADAFISIMQTNKISWCAWNWSEAPETSGMLNAGTCDAANWSSLKPTGSYVVGKVSNPADSFTACSIATNTPTPLIVPTEIIPATDLRLDSMTDGDYTSNICSNWYSYDDSNDCTDKNCTINAHGTSLIVPWSKDHWQDLGRAVQPFYMQQPGHNGAGDYAARITGVVTSVFLYGFAGLGFPLKEPEGPVDIHTATGLSFWCKSNESRTFRLKINAPQAFAGRLDEDMYGYVFTATTAWQKVSVDFASILFSQEGWGNTLVTRAMALAKVDTIQWQTQGQTGAPYNFDLWIDDVVLMNAPAALKAIATAGCGPATTPTRTATRTFTATSTRTLTPTATRTATAAATYTNTPASTFTYTRTATASATNTNTAANTATFTRTVTGSASATASVTPQNTFTYTATRTNTPNNSPTFTATRTFTAAASFTRTATGTFTVTESRTASPTISQTWTGTPPTFTNTPAISASATASASPSGTFTITGTRTASPTFTHTRADTVTFTYTVTATVPGTPTPVNTIIRTATPVNTGTPNATASVSPSPLNTGTPSATNSPVNTFTGTATPTVTPPNTFTATPTDVSTNIPTNTPTAVFTDTPTQTPMPADAKDFKITDEMTYPNPYNPGLGMPLVIRADFSQKHRNIRVKIYTPALRRIRELDFPDPSWAGERTLSVPASSLAGLANGSYYYIITAENENSEAARSTVSGLVILK